MRIGKSVNPEIDLKTAFGKYVNTNLPNKKEPKAKHIREVDIIKASSKAISPQFRGWPALTDFDISGSV